MKISWRLIKLNHMTFELRRIITHHKLVLHSHGMDGKGGQLCVRLWFISQTLHIMHSKVHTWIITDEGCCDLNAL